MQQSLETMLIAHPALSVVSVISPGLTTLKQILRLQPGLVVIDGNLSDEDLEALLAGIKAGAPDFRCLVCAHTRRRETRLLAAGADAVILRHSSGLQWHELLLQLVPPPAR
jgi:DNA-binding NarL/FixJ family response regulator